MCGICCYIGYNNSFPKVYCGILKLLNRGYDSVGITTIINNKLITHKYASDDDEMADVKIVKHINEHDDGTLSICHSRWRTTGGKTDENSHPHLDMYNIFSLVHNGIIENYTILKDMLISKGYVFKSETDTEVIVNLISYFYFLKNEKTKHNIIEAINEAKQLIEGTYALVILCSDTPNTMYCIRHGSPLLVGFSENNKFIMVASEHYGFDKNISSYISINNTDIIILEKINAQVEFTSCENMSYNPKVINLMYECHTHEPYPHWTLKEINEQVISCANAINNKGRLDETGIVKLGGLDKYKNEIVKANNLILLACGTSYHAGLMAKYIFKKLECFNSIHVIDGAEFSMSDVSKKDSTCVIFISQSGETKDLHVCLELCKEAREKKTYDLILVGIINVVDSMIAREVDCGVYLNCGKEFAVASTKAFTSQVIVITLVAMWCAQNKGYIQYDNLFKSYANKIIRLPFDIKSSIDNNEDICKNVATFLKNKSSIFILGKGKYEAIAKEGALKLKEIGYIHAEGYSSLALKHGPYALLEKNFPVILLTPNNKDFVRNQGIFDELKCRDAFVIGISDIELSDQYDVRIKIPLNSYCELTTTTILQLIAYYLSIKKNINPDFPKNLSKTISVF